MQPQHRACHPGVKTTFALMNASVEVSAQMCSLTGVGMVEGLVLGVDAATQAIHVILRMPSGALARRVLPGKAGPDIRLTGRRDCDPEEWLSPRPLLPCQTMEDIWRTSDKKDGTLVILSLDCTRVRALAPNKDIEEWLDAGGDVDAMTTPPEGHPLYGYTLLMAHCMMKVCGIEEPVELLIGRGADVNAIGMMGGTALHFSATRDDEHVPIAKMLIEAKADVNAIRFPVTDRLDWLQGEVLGNTPLDCAIRSMSR